MALHDPAALRRRAVLHATQGDHLAESGGEWAAVCWFYAAYALARAAMESDPFWTDPTAVSRVRPWLTMDDRHTTRHKGRGGVNQRQLGINDIVTLVYPGIAGRYNRGLPARHLPRLDSDIIDQALETRGGGGRAPAAWITCISHPGATRP